MEKIGVQKEDLIVGLRNQEANLMQKMQEVMSDNTKTASDRSSLENELQLVRAKITEADGANEQPV